MYRCNVYEAQVTEKRAEEAQKARAKVRKGCGMMLMHLWLSGGPRKICALF